MNLPDFLPFKNREDAGRHLAGALPDALKRADLLIFALPRGGVPVAAEIARALKKPFDVMIVRKLGVPGHDEVAMGAIVSGGVTVLNQDMIARLRLSHAEVDQVIERETAELARREWLYRGGYPNPPVAGRTVLVVDDGIATGATVTAAIHLLLQQKARRIVVAAPVAAADAVDQLRREADDVVVVVEPEPFFSVGHWYEDFSPTPDEDVQRLLADQAVVTAPATTLSAAVQRIRRQAKPLSGPAGVDDELIRLVGDADFVLLGEATHGTHEFYRQRAQITQRLILDKGFNAIAAEADWPDAYRVNRFVRGETEDADPADALSGFQRFPSWMWRNEDVLDFVSWLRDHNDRMRLPERQVGFYGLDLYSLHKSMNEVIDYLDRTDPAESAKARLRYGCLDRFGPDPQNYGLLTSAGISESCRRAVIRQLSELRGREVEFLAHDGRKALDEFFFAEQNARLVKNAEEYYRQMFRSDVSSWNLRDKHMMETLTELVTYLQSSHGSAKVVVWAHNSHLGDARATEMARRGEWNIGQLVRQAFPHRSRLIGFTTYNGTVTAAAGWHLPGICKRVRPGIEGSYEQLFHQVGIPNFWLDLTHGSEAAAVLREPRLQRAIGVVYRPESERRSHYFTTCLTNQFDAVMHFDTTRAVEPLDRTSEWSVDEAPETYPAGL